MSLKWWIIHNAPQTHNRGPYRVFFRKTFQVLEDANIHRLIHAKNKDSRVIPKISSLMQNMS